MKLIKTKLSLLALALACLFAGVMGLHPTATAKADIDTTGFTMTNGAYIRLVDDYSGISWTTTVSPAFYTAVGADANSRFGVIVAPTASIVGELTHATNGVKDIPVSYGVDASTEAVTYRSVISYNDLLTNYSGPLTDEEVLERAYAMELTARAYVTTDNGVSYTYASLDGINTSRSARQVAAAAELAGEIDNYRNDADPEVQALALNAEGYYGGDITVLAESNGAVGTPYIDKEHPTATVNVSVAVTGDFEEAVIGAEKVAATYSAGTLTITEANFIPTGENYVTVFTSTGVYATPIIGATKVFDEMEDFEEFMYIRTNVSENKISATIQEGIDAAQCVHDGYYVLANNIDASGYTRPEVGGQGGWVGAANFVGKALGLTGTFNGLGYCIDGLRLERDDSVPEDPKGNVMSGLFELVNGGTIKNFALTNLTTDASQNISVLATYGIDLVLENVYIKASFGGTIKQYVLFQTLNQSEQGEVSFNNIYLDYTYADASGGQIRAGLFEASGSFATTTKTGRYYLSSGKNVRRNETIIDFTNTYAVSNFGGFYFYETSAGKFYTCGYGENQRDSVINGTNDLNDGIYTLSGVIMPVGAHDVTAVSNSNASPYCRGAYHYTSESDFKAANHDLSAFAASGCWTIVSGVPVWSSTLS